MVLLHPQWLVNIWTDGWANMVFCGTQFITRPRLFVFSNCDSMAASSLVGKNWCRGSFSDGMNGFCKHPRLFPFELPDLQSSEPKSRKWYIEPSPAVCGSTRRSPVVHAAHRGAARLFNLASWDQRSIRFRASSAGSFARFEYGLLQRSDVKWVRGGLRSKFRRGGRDFFWSKFFLGASPLNPRLAPHTVFGGLRPLYFQFIKLSRVPVSIRHPWSQDEQKPNHTAPHPFTIRFFFPFCVINHIQNILLADHLTSYSKEPKKWKPVLVST